MLDVTYNPATVTLTLVKWDEICDMLDELEKLRERVAEYEQRDREYLQWSANGGMLEAIFAGMQLQREADNEH